MNFRRERYDPPRGEPDAGLWQVHFPLEAAEYESFRRAAASVVPAERMEFHTDLTDGADGEMTFAVRVYASTRDEAVAEARHLVNKIRQAAGAAGGSPDALGHISPWWQSRSLAARLSQEAHELQRQGRHEFAVIRIQTANELRIAETVTDLLGQREPQQDASKLMRRPMTLQDERSRAVLSLLSGQRIEAESWWSEYVEHVRRRNAILHSGVAIAADDARRSLAASIALHSWLLDVRGVDLSGLEDDPTNEDEPERADA